MNEQHDIASMLEWQAKNALENGRMNVDIDAKVIVPQIVAALRGTRPEVARNAVIEECANVVQNIPAAAALSKHNLYAASVLRGLKEPEPQPHTPKE